MIYYYKNILEVYITPLPITIYAPAHALPRSGAARPLLLTRLVGVRWGPVLTGLL